MNRLFVQTWLVFAVLFLAGCGGSNDNPKPKSSAEADLPSSYIYLNDDFSRKDGPASDFEREWKKIKLPQSTVKNGHWVMTVPRPRPVLGKVSEPGPGEVSFGGFGTTKRHLNPLLTGTNTVGITLVNFTHEKYDSKLDKPGQLVQAWSLTLGSWRGMVGDQKDKKRDRGVQLHFDLLRDDGLYVYLVRGLLPEDFGKYPQDGFGRKDSKKLSHEKQRRLHEEAIAKGGPFITVPCLALATRVYKSKESIGKMLDRSHRYQLVISDDGNSVAWLFDGKVMDKVDITGYFSSSPESTADGVYLSIHGVGCFKYNTWTMDDLVLRAKGGKGRKRK